MTEQAGAFVVGTDTGVGKTTVAVGLTRLLVRRGLRPIPFKPVETGCDPTPLDALRLWRAAGERVALRDVCPFPLPLPAAPAAAANAVGLRLDLDDLARRAADLATNGDVLVVEGAGGLLAPYGPRQTNADLAERLGLPVLLVARTSLGTINHTALTLAELARRGLRLGALVLVRTERAVAPHEAWNQRLLEATTGVAPCGTIPWLTAEKLADDDRLADAVATAIPEIVLTRFLGRRGRDR